MQESRDAHFELIVAWMECPNDDCAKPIVAVFVHRWTDDDEEDEETGELGTTGRWYVFPRLAGARKVPPEVPDPMATRYREAAAIVELSPMASAAISRRILGDLLESQGYTQFRLSKRLEAFAADAKTPHGAAEGARYLVQIGDFAAHTQKDEVTGEILDVEPGEAEWCLDVIDELFELHFVAPARMEAKKRAFDAKLARSGRKPIR